jgi:hypothetical protein
MLYHAYCDSMLGIKEDLDRHCGRGRRSVPGWKAKWSLEVDRCRRLSHALEGWKQRHPDRGSGPVGQGVPIVIADSAQISAFSVHQSGF